MQGKIRLATEKDIEDIVRLHNSDPNLSGDDKTDFCEFEDITDYLKNNITKIFVYEFNGKIIGFLIAQFNTKYIYLIVILVDREYRGKGIGKELMNYLEEKTNEQNIPLIETFTGINNKKMQDIFEKRGYKKGKTFLYYSREMKCPNT